MSEAYVVEFWPKPAKDVAEHEEPQVHAIGWPARALTLHSRVERIYITAG